jgi:hypothetical protein
MSTEDTNTSMYELADQFINLANELAQKDQSGNVGVAIRYAAARYTAFEASLQSDDLARDKEEVIDQFAKDYIKMLGINFDQYIERLSNQ